jgi:hypothetical protein
VGAGRTNDRRTRRRARRAAGLALLATLVLLGATPAALAQTTPTPTPSPSGPTPTPPPPSDPPNSGTSSGTVDGTGAGGLRSNPDRPPGSGGSTDDVPPEVPGPSPTPITDCEPFSYRQTYRGWGPARAYGRQVSVLYRADRCVKLDGGVLELTMAGTAEIREGGRNGQVIGNRPFELEGTWVHPSIEDGWPPDWWQCRVADLQYVWRIAGRYSFAVDAEDGRWHLEVVTVRRGRARTVTWSYDACR